MNSGAVVFVQKHRSQKNSSRYINIYGLSDNNLKKKSQDYTDFHEINLGGGATDVLSRVQDVAVEEEVVTYTQPVHLCQMSCRQS